MLRRLFHAVRRLFLEVREAKAARERELQRVDDPEELRRELQTRNRRLLVWLGAMSLGGLLFGLMVGRIYHGDVGPRQPIVPQVRVAQAAEYVDEGSGRPMYRLVLSLNKALQYERYRPDGALNLRLPNISLVGGNQSAQVNKRVTQLFLVSHSAGQGRQRACSWTRRSPGYSGPLGQKGRRPLGVGH